MSVTTLSAAERALYDLYASFIAGPPKTTNIPIRKMTTRSSGSENPSDPRSAKARRPPALLSVRVSLMSLCAPCARRDRRGSVFQVQHVPCHGRGASLDRGDLMQGLELRRSRRAP